MAGAIDDDTARAVASGRETAGAMLSTAQSNLKRVFLFFLAGMLAAFFALRWYVWDVLKRDVLYAQMDEATRQATTVVATTPFEVILLQVKVGLIVGVIVAVPSVVWYSREALKRRGYWPDDRIPRWKVAALLVFVAVLFVAGVFYAYSLFFPLMFAFLAENAVNAGFEPTYSIAKWTEFILLLTLSFGLAAQLPLGMSGMALSGVVPYETFREKWRYAVVGIFVFGAMFSPPDPFTQIMWAVPLIALYGFSLGLTKLLVLTKRAGEHVPVRGLVRDRWNVLAGTFVLVGGGVYAFLTRGGLEAANAALGAVGSSYRLPAAADLGALGLAPSTVAAALAAGVGVLGTVLAVFYLRIRALEAMATAPHAGTVTGSGAGAGTATADAETTAAGTAPSAGDPAEIDIDALSAPAVKAAPPQAFADLTEEEAVGHAERALEDDDAEKAEAILDRFDEAQEIDAEPDDADGSEESADPITSTTTGVVNAFTEDQKSEEDIGGYYYDAAFILDSLTSKAIWIVGTFMVVLAASFIFLYSGGIGDIKNSFLGSMPEALAAEVSIVTLHPVEALIFEIKFSTLLAALSVLPLVLYFAWPAIEQRGWTTGNRNVLLAWGGTLGVALVGGSLLGFFYVAPTIISALALDALTSNMIIAYRINNFGWLVIFTTLGIGILAEIPVTMWLFARGNIVPYRLMREHWRVVVLAVFTLAALFSPGGVFTMFLLALPAVFAYGVGLGVLGAVHRLRG
jgi:sec-independent protein translocase protein TatC